MDKNQDFAGAKVAIFVGPLLLVIQRDNYDHIPFPGFWDLPGGGREGFETPEACAMREAEEEIGLRLSLPDLVWAQCYQREIGLTWFFAAHLPASAEQYVKLGDEGQRWALWTPQEYIDHPHAVPHFREHVRDYMREPAAAQRLMAS